jgi:molecular chaperone DnaK
VSVHVLQGEREMAKDNRALGRFDLVGIPPAPRGVPQIEVTFDIDANGIVHVSATDLGTGRAQEIVIKQHGGLTAAEIDRMVAEAEKYSVEDRSKKAYSHALNDAQNLLYATEQTVREFSDRLSPQDLRDTKAAMNRLLAARDGGPRSIGELKEATESLQAMMHKFAELIYSGPGSGDPLE